VATQYTPEEALELILNCNLSKQAYINIRKSTLSKGCNIYPDYKQVWLCKSKCRPSGMIATDIMAEVPLKNVLEHTTQRIVQMQKEVILQKMENLQEMKTEIIFSYGFDGSSGQSNYKQKFESTGNYSDNSLFATTCIPLRLQSLQKDILWNNITPQSIRFCRPIKLQYVKETECHVLQENENLAKSIKSLDELKIDLGENKTLIINYQLFLTLIDGKILNALTGTKSTRSCPICGATPAMIRDTEDFGNSDFFKPKPNSLKYGASPLHAWIRFFECVIHISYRIDLCEWEVRGEENKKIVQERKKMIQDRFLKKMHLLVDKPKPNGFGSTNDGNTSRRAFANTKLFAEITEVNEELINRFRIILITLSCNLQTDPIKFGLYCHETVKLYMLKYSWYPMPPSVHKILIHGRQIVENSVLPVGYFGEEGSEGRNKFYKQDRQFHARKTSRKHNLEDIFNRAMDTSDPIISSINLASRIRSQKKLPLPSEVIDMLMEAEENPTDDEEELDEEEEIVDINEILPTVELDNFELDCEEDNNLF